MKQTKRLALCGVLTALAVALQTVGSWLGLGTYLCPILAGLLLMPIGRELGGRWQLLVWLAVGLLDLMLVADPEQNLMFLCFFGWYPVVYPGLERIPKGLRVCVKLLLFNAAVVSAEVLLMRVLVPEQVSVVFALVLLALGNVIFISYDRLIPILTAVYEKKLRPILKR